MAKRNLKTSEYTGNIMIGNVFQRKSTGCIVRVETIKKNNDGVWMLTLHYLQSLIPSKDYQVVAHDFQKKVEWEYYKKLI